MREQTDRATTIETVHPAEIGRQPIDVARVAIGVSPLSQGFVDSAVVALSPQWQPRIGRLVSLLPEFVSLALDATVEDSRVDAIVLS